MNEEYAGEIARGWFELFTNFQETLGDSDPLTATAYNEYIRWNMIRLTEMKVK